MSEKLLVSNKTNLISKYGLEGFNKIHSKLGELIIADKERNLTTSILYIDDPESCRTFNVEPTIHGDKPRSVKLVLDMVLSTYPQEYICIIGGDEIIPFFRFNNPLFDPTLEGDDDEFILTDNPYASTNSHLMGPDFFLIPDRSIGRLPDETGDAINNPELIIKQIENSITASGDAADVSIRQWGLSAEVWEDASRAVIDYLCMPPENYFNSPPMLENNFDLEIPNNKIIHYFNLHGSATTADWYGQTGIASFPTAYNPRIVNDVGRKFGINNTIVATEACYGGDIIDRKIDDSLTLTYMYGGCIGFVGSTTIAYGPSEPPNTAADLIAKYFLKEIQQGHSLGSALTEAKIKLGEDAAYYGEGLDDADYKTLLQFVLYGDPSIHPLLPSGYPKMFIREVDEATTNEARSKRRRRSTERAKEAKSLFPTKGKLQKLQITEIPDDVQQKFKDVFNKYSKFKPIFTKKRDIGINPKLAKILRIKQEDQKVVEYIQVSVKPKKEDKPKEILFSILVVKKEKIIVKKLLFSK